MGGGKVSMAEILADIASSQAIQPLTGPTVPWNGGQSPKC